MLLSKYTESPACNRTGAYNSVWNSTAPSSTTENSSPLWRSSSPNSSSVRALGWPKMGTICLLSSSVAG